MLPQCPCLWAAGRSGAWSHSSFSSRPRVQIPPQMQHPLSLVLPFLSSFLLFGRTAGYTQRSPLRAPPQGVSLCIMRQGLTKLLGCPGWSGTCHPPASTSWSPEVTGAHCCAQVPLVLWQKLEPAADPVSPSPTPGPHQRPLLSASGSSMHLCLRPGPAGRLGGGLNPSSLLTHW